MTRLLQYLRVLFRWRKLILVNALAITLLAAVVSMVLPFRFSATAQILPPPEDDPLGLASVLGGGSAAGRLRRLATGNLGGGTSSDLMVGILGSRSVMEKVAESCSIIERLGIKRGSVEEALKALGRMTSFTVSDEGIVRVDVETKSPDWAAEIANCYVDELDAFLRSSNISRGRNMRRFVGRRLAEVESELALAQESLRVFQELHRTASVDKETEAAIDAYASLKSQLLVKEAELGLMRELASETNPYAVSLESETRALRAQLRRFEVEGGKDGFGVGFAVPFDRLPAVAGEYLRRYRDFKISEETYAMLYQQYEQARIMEARDTPTLTVLDWAVPPEKRSFPRRFLVVLAAFVFSLFAGIAFALGAEYFVHLRDVRPDEYAAWDGLRHQSFGLLRGLFRRKGRGRRPS